MKRISYGMSHTGLSRSKNEDAFFVDDDLGLYIVADGVGGLSHGEVASRMTVDLIVEAFRLLPPETLPDWPALLNRVSHAIFSESEAIGAVGGMGSTVTLVQVRGNKIHFAHVGDTALLLFRKNEPPHMLTTDHTIGQELIEKSTHLNEIYIPEIYMHSLTRCMGQPDPLMVDTGAIDIEAGERLLLISDGILLGWELDELYTTAFKHHHPQSYVNELIEKANKAGGHDNSTAIALFFERTGETDA